jgi:hypothetical protein
MKKFVRAWFKALAMIVAAFVLAIAVVTAGELIIRYPTAGLPFLGFSVVTIMAAMIYNVEK